jgi:hypothetical protein
MGHVTAALRQPVLQELKHLQRHVPVLQRFRGLLPASVVLRMAVDANNRPGLANGHVAPTAVTTNTIRPFAPMMIRRQYGARATFTAERARRELGWTPRVTPAQAIDHTCEWVKFAGL